MKTAAQTRKEESRKRRRANERWRKWIEDLRRRRQRAERDRRRRWLLALLLALLESKPAQMFFSIDIVAPEPEHQKRQERSRKTPKNGNPDAQDDPRSEYDRLYLYDYSTRYGEEELEIYDGLTWNDIVAYNKIHRPHLFPKFVPIPGMPKCYSSEQVHVWTLLDHIGSEYHRKDAITALKLIVSPEAHDWIAACSATDEGWKDLTKCRRRTPEMTIYEFPRAAARWRDELRREAEEKKRAAKETPENGPKPPRGR